MARWPQAIWQPGAPASGTLRPVAVTLHHQAGNGNPLPVYISRRVSAHFWLPKAGQPVQHVDTAVQAWHGGNALNPTSIGVETEGCPLNPGGQTARDEPLTDHQLNTFAALMQWANRTHGIPLAISNSATQPGLNYHRVASATACPCDLRLAARPEILRRAGAATPVPPPPTPTPTPGGGGTAAPPFPGRLLRQPPTLVGNDVRTWQQRMATRGWRITVDGAYGPASAQVCRQFQQEKRLAVDGIVGPVTWAASWTAPIT